MDLIDAKEKEEGGKPLHGGKRPGAGRPKGAADKKPRKRGEQTEARQVTMRASVWALADLASLEMQMTRPEFFELAVLKLAQEKVQK